MRRIITAWCTSDELTFESQLCLQFLGERNRSLGITSSFDVLFLEGLERLSVDYRKSLSSLGYNLYDLKNSYLTHQDRFPTLMRFGDYERKCFLRWLVIKDACGDTPFIHYDADIVFNAAPEEFESNFSGLTFILQGCPAYARIEDTQWLKNYENELKRFSSNLETYSAHAWRQRAHFVSTFKERNSALWHRHVISSDQDLLQFLTLSGILPQADAVAVNSSSSIALFQNPLVIGNDICSPLPLLYERKNGIDYIGNRKVAFWHMQGDFCDYLAYATFRKSMHLKGRVPLISKQKPFSYLAYRAFKRLNASYTRKHLLMQYFGSSQDLAFLFKDQAFWQDGVFV